MTNQMGRRIGLLMLVACAVLTIWCIVKTLAWLEGVEPKTEWLTVGPGPVPPIPNEADIIAHGTGSEPYEITVPRGDLSKNRIIILPNLNVEYLTKDSLRRDYGLDIRCKEEKVTGKQVNPSSTTAWVPCSRIDQLWMDGQLVWQRPKK
jgi:hypothetical protein